MALDHRTWQPLSAEEAQAMLQRIGLPSGEIAARINETPRDVRHWRAGKRPVSFGQWCKLRLLELTLD